jgi:hypothetical protein
VCDAYHVAAAVRAESIKVHRALGHDAIAIGGGVIINGDKIAASEIPGPVGEVPRSPSTHSVTRRAAGTLTDTVLVPVVPLSD